MFGTLEIFLLVFFLWIIVVNTINRYRGEVDKIVEKTNSDLKSTFQEHDKVKDIVSQIINLIRQLHHIAFTLFE